MAEREIEILAVDGAHVAVRPLGACSDCSGCGGRCNLFRGSDREEVGTGLPLELFPELPHAGEHWRLVLPERELLAQAGWSYGLALAGLVLGAALGHALSGDGPWRDAATAAAALAGTLLALRFSKRRPAGALRLHRVPPP